MPTSSPVFTKPSPSSWNLETVYTTKFTRWFFERLRALKFHDANTSCETPKSSKRTEGIPIAFFLWPVVPADPDILLVVLPFFSAMLAPCIIDRMPRSSSLMSSVLSGTFLDVWRSAMMASFWTTFSRSFISLELSMSVTSSSFVSAVTSALNLNTVDAIFRTVPNIRSNGRTARSVTTLDKAKPQKTMMRMMKSMVLMLNAASTWFGECMLTSTMKVAVCTINEDESRGGPALPASQAATEAAMPVVSVVHVKSVMPAEFVKAVPRQALYGP
mmetsp:Transcript_2645/g.6000  ORF Transcript_2645/g.6000 Transcript_2645/m.6000 type:complete len:273 (-) Transcript_2645:967-1785(-)